MRCSPTAQGSIPVCCAWPSPSRRAELSQRAPAIDAYALSRLRLSADGQPCPFGPVTHLADRLSDGAYAVLRLRAACPAVPASVRVHYGLMFDLDPCIAAF